MYEAVTTILGIVFWWFVFHRISKWRSGSKPLPAVTLTPRQEAIQQRSCPLARCVEQISYRREAELRRLAEYEAKREMEKRRRSLSYLRTLNGTEFEELTVKTLDAMGYMANRVGGSGDGGIDIEVMKGKKRVIIQCKQHSSPAGPREIRDLYGTLIDSGADGAAMVCTSGFTQAAVSFAKGKPIELVDGETLTGWVLKTGTYRDPGLMPCFDV